MDAILRKIKYVFAMWAGLSLVGAAMISCGMNASAAAYISIIGFFLLYYFAFDVIPLPVREANFDIIIAESADFRIEIEDLKLRAVQLYKFNSPEQSIDNFKKARIAYKSALLNTIAYAENDQSVSAYFTNFFNQNLNSPTANKEIPSIDHLVIELSSKQHRTQLQNEYLSFITHQILKNGRGIEEIEFAYKISPDRLSVKKPFSSWLGLHILKVSGFLETNSTRIGLEDFANLELPASKKILKLDS